jgi:hypothetical protein
MVDSQDLKSSSRFSVPVSSFAFYMARVFKRPRPWILGYLVLLLPSLLIVPLLALPLLEWARTPLFRAALEARSLDLLLDFFTGVLADMRFGTDPGAGSPLFLVGICGLLVLWPLLKLLWVWVEGGTLVTYTDPAPPSWARFWEGCRRYFGPFLLLNLLGVLAIGLVGGVTLALSVGFTRLAPLLGWGGMVVAGLLVAGLATWVETARAIAVVNDDRHVIHALRNAGDIIVGYPLAILALMGVSSALYGVLFGIYRGLITWIPIPWWLLSFGVQQIYLIARLGVRLARQAGEVGLARYPCED